MNSFWDISWLLPHPLILRIFLFRSQKKNFFERVMDGVNDRVGQLKGQDVNLGGSWTVQSGLLGPPPSGNGQSWLFYAHANWSQLFHEGQGQLCCCSDQWEAEPAIPEPVKGRTHLAEPWDFNTVVPMAPGGKKDQGHLGGFFLLCQSPCLLWVCLGYGLLSLMVGLNLEIEPFHLVF